MFSISTLEKVWEHEIRLFGKYRKHGEPREFAEHLDNVIIPSKIKAMFWNHKTREIVREWIWGY